MKDDCSWCWGCAFDKDIEIFCSRGISNIMTERCFVPRGCLVVNEDCDDSVFLC